MSSNGSGGRKPGGKKERTEGEIASTIDENRPERASGKKTRPSEKGST